MKMHLIAFALVAGIASISLVPDANAAEEGAALPSVDWSFSGPFGTFDRAQLQRGYKVYKEVCANCHSMRLLAFRNLGQRGGPEFSEPAVEVLAAEATVTDGPNDDGDMFERPGKPADRFPSPFANEQAARASNGGAYPPDLSVIAKARAGGPNYLHALLTGYEEPPAGFELREGMQYNAFFPGHQIGMPPPLSEGAVEYTDETPATVDQYAKDVAAFLMWAAEPSLEARHETGFKVIIFLLVLSGLMYLTKKKVWAREAH